MLDIRSISMSRVIWVDANIHNDENTKHKAKLEEEFKNIGFSYSDSVESAVSQINSTVKCVLITSGQMGKILLPKVHE